MMLCFSRLFIRDIVGDLPITKYMSSPQFIVSEDYKALQAVMARIQKDASDATASSIEAASSSTRSSSRLRKK
jgi:hypothetical protein